MLPLHGKRLRLSLLDVAIVLALLAAGVFVFYRIRDGLNYRWEWSALPQYLFRFDGEQGRWLPNVLMQGFFTTIRLSIWATVFATLIGTTMGLIRLSRSRFRRWVAAAYVELTRNTPPLVLVFVFYYFIGEQVLPRLGPEATLRHLGPNAQSLLSTLLAPPGLLTAFLSAVVTLSIFEGAYITEIVRAGIQSIDRGQREAAAALGLSRWQRLRHVILPQALQRILPPLGGQFISTIKDSSIVSVISIQELTFRGMELMSATYLSFETWITISAMYFILTFGCSLGFERLEKRLQLRGG
jgi:polar amino acid transport system permease protein